MTALEALQVGATAGQLEQHPPEGAVQSEQTWTLANSSRRTAGLGHPSAWMFVPCSLEGCRCLGMLVFLPSRTKTLESAMDLQILACEVQSEAVSAPWGGGCRGSCARAPARTRCCVLAARDDLGMESWLPSGCGSCRGRPGWNVSGDAHEELHRRTDFIFELTLSSPCEDNF